MTYGIFDNDQDDITEKVWGDFDDSEGLHRMTLKKPLPFKDLVASSAAYLALSFCVISLYIW